MDHIRTFIREYIDVRGGIDELSIDEAAALVALTESSHKTKWDDRKSGGDIFIATKGQYVAHVRRVMGTNKWEAFVSQKGTGSISAKKQNFPSPDKGKIWAERALSSH